MRAQRSFLDWKGLRCYRKQKSPSYLNGTFILSRHIRVSFCRVRDHHGRLGDDIDAEEQHELPVIRNGQSQSQRLFKFVSDLEAITLDDSEAVK